MEPIWSPSPQRIANSHIIAFMEALAQTWHVRCADYDAIYRFSIDEPEKFWVSVWDFCQIIAERRGEVVVRDIGKLPGARWFPEARLNFAENHLRRRDDGEAIVALSDAGAVRRLSFAQLYDEVSRAEQALRASGVKSGDRIAGYMPNGPEAVIAMLATTALGAIWSVCSTDLGAEAVIDRIAQIAPKIFITSERYKYEGKTIDLLGRAAVVAGALASCERFVVVCADEAASRVNAIPKAVMWHAFVAPYAPQTLVFDQFPFEHPLLILFSSGTSGRPKCIVHSAGGALLQNVKDLKLQFDVKRDDRIFWWTGTGWVVWNLMLFGLACEATVMLYDDSPFYPAPQVLFDHAERERVTFLRLTPKYVETIAKAGLEPARTHDLSHLKCITVGGAPFGPAGYEYVYTKIKPDVQLASPAGGTDPLCALVSGNPMSPVWTGEMQCRALGVKLEVFDERAQRLTGEAGELVCTMAFPSMPLGFWGDDTGERFRETYFGLYPNVWRQGDWAAITPRGGVVIYGRSDATLKVRGVRFGTAEIYRPLEQIAGIADSVVVAHEAQGVEEIVLFVQLAPGRELSDALADSIRARIRADASPRYVPDRIIAVADIPRTSTGKVSELAVRAALHGRPVPNTAALVNAQALSLFKPEILQVHGSATTFRRSTPA